MYILSPREEIDPCAIKQSFHAWFKSEEAGIKEFLGGEAPSPN